MKKPLVVALFVIVWTALWSMIVLGLGPIILRSIDADSAVSLLAIIGVMLGAGMAYTAIVLLERRWRR